VKKILTVIVGVVAVVAFAQVSPAASQAGGSPCAPGGPNNSNNPNRTQYPPQECGLRLGQSQARPGEDVSVAGDGYRGNSPVAIEFRSVPQNVGSATATGAGSFSTTIRIPTDATVGRHTIAATGVNPDGSARELTADVTIVAAAAAARPATLPRTGDSPAPLLVIGGTLVALGAAARPPKP
jgi:hypothetical protein